MPSIDERAAYAHFHEHRKHIASFCGTGNNVHFLPTAIAKQIVSTLGTSISTIAYETTRELPQITDDTDSG